MPRAKRAPAYQWYPRDYMADAIVQAMTLEQEGAYRRLLDHCWLEHGLPVDLDELWPLAKCPSREFFETRIWNVVGRKFYLRRNRFQQKRLDRERAKQAKTRRVRQLAAKKMHEQKRSKRDANAPRVQCLSSSSSTASSAAAVPTRSARGKVFVGARLVVSQKQHAVMVDQLGASATYVDWMQLYVSLDEALVASKESFDTLEVVRRAAQERVKAMRRGGPLFIEPEGDWFTECQQLHGGNCGGRVKHHTRMQIDAEKAKAATA